MEEFTRKFNVAQEKDAEIRHILTTVYAALEDKGYNPINQIVGYILSEDPTYITNHNNARTLIRKLDRDELLQTLVRKENQIEIQTFGDRARGLRRSVAFFIPVLLTRGVKNAILQKVTKWLQSYNSVTRVRSESKWQKLRKASFTAATRCAVWIISSTTARWRINIS